MEYVKAALFGLIVIVVLGITGYLVWSTISTNIKSVTGGPVHYHADFQIWNCGEQVDLVDPKGWDNKVGTALFHEHNDNRIHVEGPVMDYKDITLGKFFEVAGGELDSTLLVVPTNNDEITMENGTKCNGVPGSLQVFVHKTQGKTFYQEKLTDPVNFVLSSYSNIPPGDCIIIEFDREKEITDKMCSFYELAIQKGEILNQVQDDK